MRSLQRPRNALLLVLVALACTGGSFTCHSSDHHGDRVDVDGQVNN